MTVPSLVPRNHLSTDCSFLVYQRITYRLTVHSLCTNESAIDWLFIPCVPRNQLSTDCSFLVYQGIIIIIIINSLAARVVGAPQMILQAVFSIFPCSPLPSGTCRTPGLSISRCCLPTSSSVSLVFFPLSLCLARWFWPDLMNGKHDHSTAVCVSLRSSGGLRVVQCLLDLGTDFLVGNIVFVWDVYLPVAPHFHGLYSSLELCCECPWFTNIQEDGCDKGTHQSYLGAERNTLVNTNWSMLLLSVLSWTVFQAWNRHQFCVVVVSLVVVVAFSSLASFICCCC